MSVSQVQTSRRLSKCQRPHMDAALSFSLPPGPVDEAAVHACVHRLVRDCFGSAGEDDSLSLYLSTLLVNRRTLSHVQSELTALDFSDCSAFILGLWEVLREPPTIINAMPPAEAVVPPVVAEAARPPILSKRKRDDNFPAVAVTTQAESPAQVLTVMPNRSRGAPVPRLGVFRGRGRGRSSRFSVSVPLSQLRYVAATASPLPTSSVPSPTVHPATKVVGVLPALHRTWTNKHSIPCKFGSSCFHVDCEYGHAGRDSICSTEVSASTVATGTTSAAALRLARVGMRPSLKFAASAATHIVSPAVSSGSTTPAIK